MPILRRGIPFCASTSGHCAAPCPAEAVKHCPQGDVDPWSGGLSLPEWWNAEKLLALIHEAIDVVTTDRWGTGWHAVSDVRTGLVWVDERLLWKSLKAVGCHTDIDLLLAKATTADRRAYLTVVIRELSRKGKIAVELTEDGYHQVPVTVVTGAGRRLSRFLIPFKPTAFGETMTDLEKRKGEDIRKMVAEVIPRVVDHS